MVHRLAVAFLGLIGLTIIAHAAEKPDAIIDDITKPWFGDYSAMKKDKSIRVLIPYSITNYFVDKGQQKGISVEYMREFEKFLNKGVKKELDKIGIVLIPTRRDKLMSAVVEGRGDIAVANLTITPERLEKVDFSDPLLTDVREIVITNKDHAEIKDLKDLSGMTVHVRESASYFASLVAANEELKKLDLEPVTIVAADSRLEDEDLLEMVHTDIIPAIIMDEHKAELWLQMFDKAKIHSEFAIREGGEIAWAFRKESPELAKVINEFLVKAKAGTELGNTLLKRYFSNVDQLINPKTDAYQKKLDQLIGLFRKYGEKYDIDPMLLAAQAFQESRFDHEARSKVGAVGIMQVLPSTAKDKNIAIKDITKLENNIEAGAKYMRFVADHYFPDADIPDLQKILFVFASYNAGPNRVARARKKAKDPLLWFDSVDWEVAKAAGTEPIRYVKNIYVYYVTFKSLNEDEKQEPAK